MITSLAGSIRWRGERISDADRSMAHANSKKVKTQTHKRQCSSIINICLTACLAWCLNRYYTILWIHLWTILACGVSILPVIFQDCTHIHFESPMRSSISSSITCPIGNVPSGAVAWYNINPSFQKKPLKAHGEKWSVFHIDAACLPIWEWPSGIALINFC